MVRMRRLLTRRTLITSGLAAAAGASGLAIAARLRSSLNGPAFRFRLS